MADATVAETLDKLIPFEKSPDPEASVRRITHAAKILNSIAITDFGGRQGPERQSGLVEQVVAAAFQTFEGEDAHPNVFEKAAMLMRGITGGHPFEDGNKRTGFLTAIYFLHQNGIDIPENFSENEAESLCLRISSGELRDIDEIQSQIEKIWSA